MSEDKSIPMIDPGYQEEVVKAVKATLEELNKKRKLSYKPLQAYK